jgi:hypothetical protein
MVMLDAVFLAETIDHANWEAMAKIAEMLDDGPVKEAFQAAVDEVEDQEDEHVTWARDMRMKMTHMQLEHSLVSKGMAKVEELAAKLKGG